MGVWRTNDAGLIKSFILPLKETFILLMHPLVALFQPLTVYQKFQYFLPGHVSLTI